MRNFKLIAPTIISLPTLTALFSLLFSSAIHAQTWPGTDFNGTPCIGKPSNYGPYDYTNPKHRLSKLAIVEQYHFTPQIKQLSPKMRDRDLYHNLDYTLRAFPNHYSALNSLVMLSLQSKMIFPTPVECYFQRALTISPNDATTHLVHAIYLHRIKRYKLAESAYQNALDFQPDSAETAYNYGLLLVDLKRYKEAVSLAQKAYQEKYPLPGLKLRLEKAGYSLTTN